MERLKLDLVQLHKALNTLENAFIVAHKLTQTNNQDFVLAAEDSIIQRFEYCYESFWKFLRKYLQNKHNLEDINSPRKVFKAAVSVEICSLEEGNAFLNMAEDRNETSHTYNIEATRSILSDIPLYYAAMITCTKRFNQELET